MNSRVVILISLFFSVYPLFAQKTIVNEMEAEKPDSAVVYLEVDLMGEFHEGLCSVKKGDEIGFINAKGEYLIPLGLFTYHKNNFLLTEENMPRFSDGLCRVVKPVLDQYNNSWNRYGFINKSGELVIDYKLDYLGNFKNGFAYQSNDGYFYDKNGEKVNTEPIWENYFEFPEGVKLKNFQTHGIVPIKNFHQNIRGKDSDEEYYTYYDIYMNPVIKGNFVDAGLFSEGLAPVAAVDDSTGQVKWGYINEKGETVIDFQFDRKPGDFSDSLAAVFVDSLNVGGPKIGFINPTGELEVIIPYQEGQFAQWTPLKFYDDWLVLWEGRGFKSYNRQKIIARGLKIKDTCGKYFYEIGRPIFPVEKINDKYVLVSSAKSPCGLRGLIIYTPGGELIMPPLYDQFGRFDKDSGLAKITHVSSRNRSVKEGFINIKGEFVIIKGKNP